MEHAVRLATIYESRKKLRGISDLLEKCREVGTSPLDFETLRQRTSLLQKAINDIVLLVADMLNQEQKDVCLPPDSHGALLVRRQRRFELALQRITKMGRVCPEFELCSHPWCSDSCGAVLTALAALDDTLICPSCKAPWDPQDEVTCGPCGAHVPNGPLRPENVG